MCWNIIEEIIHIRRWKYIPSASNSFASLRARDEEISRAWAAGTMTNNMASLWAA